MPTDSPAPGNLGRDYYRALQAWRKEPLPVATRVTEHNRERHPRQRYERGSLEALRVRELKRSVRRKMQRPKRAEWERNLRESHADRLRARQRRRAAAGLRALIAAEIDRAANT